MSHTGFSINTGAAAFHPVSHYESPAAVLADPKLSAPEKRLILSSWASDMYAVESQPALRAIPGLARPVRLADILGALRQLDQDDQPPRPRGGAAMRIAPYTDIRALGAPAARGSAILHEEHVHSPQPAPRRARFSREANVRRYRKLLATKLAEHERRFVERRLAEELQRHPGLAQGGTMA